MTAVVGLLLAAGAGLRLGQPKALVADADGLTWVARSAAALEDGGATPVYVVVGADRDAVARALPPGCAVVAAPQWQEGMGASLRAGLGAVMLNHPAAAAVIVMLVDTPGVGADVVRRLAGLAEPAALARASFEGDYGHPVLIGRDHWSGVLEVARGDAGARDYLTANRVTLVDCSDIGSGADIDTADRLRDWRLS